MHKMNRRAWLTGATALSGAAMLGTRPAKAQSYPQRPVRLIVPYAPGGGTDVFSRLLAQQIEKEFGQGSLMLNCANLVSQWFDRRRGFAMSLMALGFAASMAVHPPLGQALIEMVGWRTAWVILGVLTWAVLLPPVLLLIHDKPELKGLEPDGGEGAAAIQLGPRPVGAGVGLTLPEALRTAAFYLVIFGMFSISMLVTVLHFYQVTIFTARGLDPAVAARVFPISAAVMVLTMPLVGRLLDRLQTRFAFALALCVQATSLIAQLSMVNYMR